MEHLIKHHSPDGDLTLFSGFKKRYGVDGLERFGIQTDKRTKPRHALRIPMHSHEGIVEINFLSKGTQSYQIGEQLFSLKTRTVYVVGPGVVHGSGEFFKEKGVTYYLQFRIPKEDEFLGFIPLLGMKLKKCLLSLGTGVFPGDHELERLLARLNRVLDSSGDRASFQISQICAETIFKVCDLAQKNTRQAISPMVMRSMERMKAAKEPSSIESLAKAEGMSYSRFIHKFKQETGESPKARMVQIQVEKSISLLQGSGKSVVEIGYLSGFPSTEQFIYQFRKLMGTPPGRFRARLKK